MANYVSKHTGAQIDAAVENVGVLEGKVTTLSEEIDALKENGGGSWDEKDANKVVGINDNGVEAPMTVGAGLRVEDVAQKNIVFGDWENGHYGSNGQWNATSTGKTHAGINQKFPAEPSTTYTASGTSNLATTNLYILQWDKHGALVANSGAQTIQKKLPYTFQTKENTAYVGVYVYDSANGNLQDIIPDNFMIEVGNSATEYEPYNPTKTIKAEVTADMFLGLEDYTEEAESTYIDPAVFQNATISNTGVYTPLTTGKTVLSTKEFFPAEANTTYNFRFDADMTISGVYIAFYADDNESAYLSTQSVYTVVGNVEYTCPDGSKYARFRLYNEETPVEQMQPRNIIISISGQDVYPIQDRVIRLDRLDTVKIFEAMRYAGLVKGGAPVPEYYYDNGYISQKCERIKELYDTCAGNGDAFYFVTDQHWHINAHNSPALMNMIAKQTNVYKVFCGGDTGDSPSIEYAKEMESAMGKDVRYAMGNHDYFDTDGHKLCRIFDANKTDQIGNAYRHYYYVDNQQQKIRYVVLSCYDYNEETDAIVGAYEDAQIAWLRDAALDVEDDWVVVVFTHILDGMGNTAAVKEVLTSATCDIACVIHGHLHKDQITHLSNGIPVVGTTCDKCDPWISGGENMEPWLSNRVRGTITEQAFDVVVLDKEQRKLTFVRIGAPADNMVDGTSTGTVEERVVTY